MGRDPVFGRRSSGQLSVCLGAGTTGAFPDRRDVGHGESEGSMPFWGWESNYHLEAMKFDYLFGAISD